MAGAVFIFAMLASANAGASPASIRSAAELGSKWGAVTSVLRSPEHNRLVGGVPNSFHLSGQAVDIARRPGVRHAEIDAAFRKAGYVLIESLDEGDHSHFAFQLSGSAPRAPRAKVIQAASADGASEACAAAAKPAAMLEARRRPDRSDGCEDVRGSVTAAPLQWANQQAGSSSGS